MKLFGFSLLFLLFFNARGVAQIDSSATLDQTAVDTTQTITQTFSNWFIDNWHRPEQGKLERVSYVLGSSLVFSLFDYIGWNYVTRDLHEERTAVNVYRTAQVLVQLGLSYFLYEEAGLSSVAAFNLIWWTWGDDVGYYGWANAINPAAPWENRHHHGLMSKEINWAGWTPIGLLRKPKANIARDALIPQAIVGFGVSLYIN